MKTIQNCPKCHKILEPVRNNDGETLGYFCTNIIHKACDYINVMSSYEYECWKKGSVKNEDVL